MLRGKKICCAILAGGKAERLPDKPFLLLDGKPLISYVLDVVDAYFEDVLIIVKKEQKDIMKKILQNKKQVKVITEKSEDFSPWNGIKTAVENTNADWIFLLACDMPFVNVKLFDLLVSKISPNIDCVIPKTDRLQPLCALYRKSVLEGCWMHRNPQAVSIFEGSVTRFAESLKKEVVQLPQEIFFWLFNINTREDFEMAEGMMKNQAFKDLMRI